MAQFDVHRALGARRMRMPFVVIVQSRNWDTSASRLMMPLYDATHFAAIQARLTPLVIIEGIRLMANPLNIFPMEVRKLGPYVVQLDEAHGEQMIAAIDEAISRAYG